MSIPPQKPLYEALLPDSDKINQLQNFFTRPVLGTFYSNAENACKSLQILEETEQRRWYKNYIYLYQLYSHYAEKLKPSDADTLSIQEELNTLRQQLERTKVNESTIFKTWKSLSAENDDLHTEIAKLRHQLQNSASAVSRQPQQEKDRRTWARYEQTGEIVPTEKLDAMLPPLPEDGRIVPVKEIRR